MKLGISEKVVLKDFHIVRAPFCVCLCCHSTLASAQLLTPVWRYPTLARAGR
jgi:hypothetical protein